MKCFIATACLIAIAPTLAASDNAPPAYDLSGSAGLNHVDGRLLGVGDDYIVEFTRRGFELTPAFGRSVDQPRSLAFQLESIQRGAATVVTVDADVVPRVDGLVARYERGSGVAELYEVGPDGIAQSFRFDEPLSGSGDLVVRGTLTTPLALEEHTPGNPLRFHETGIGGINYGTVTGIDARGESAPGSLRLVGTQLELVLPADFVDTARYPLVLDPLIGPELDPGNSTGEDVDPAVAYNATEDIYLVAWAQSTSLVASYIRGTRFDSAGNYVGAPFVIDILGSLAGDVRVANVEQRDRFVVSSRLPGPLGAQAIRLMSVAASDAQVSTVAEPTADGSYAYNYDLGGSQGELEDSFLAVWQNEAGGIDARVGHVAASGTPAFDPILSLSTSPDDSWPAVSRHGGAQGHWLVTWQRFVAGSGGDPDRHDLYGMVVASDGSQLTGETLLVGDAQSNDVQPACANVDGARFHLAWQRSPASGGGDDDVYCAKVDFDAGSGTLVSGPPIAIAATPGMDERQPSIDYAGAKSILAWTSLTSPFESDVRAVGIDVNCKICETTYDVGATGAYETKPRVAACFSASSTAGDRALVTWEANTFAPPFTGDIVAQQVEALGAGGGVVTLFPGCGTGGVCQVNGPPALGNPDFAIELAFADPGGTIAFLALNLQDSFFFCGLCTWLIWPSSPGLIFVDVPIAGSASVSIPLPCTLPLAGAGVNAQWVVKPTTSSLCALDPNTGYSSIIEITLGF